MPARDRFWNCHLQYSKMQKSSSPLCWAQWWGLILPFQPLSSIEGLTSFGWPGPCYRMDSLISPPCGVPGMELRSPDLRSKCSHLLSRPADPIAFISILFLPFFGGLWCCFEIQSHTVVQDGLKLMAILLPQPLKCQHCGHEWPCSCPSLEMPALWAWVAMPSNFIYLQRGTTLGWQRRLSYTSLTIQYWSLESMWKAGWRIP